MSRKMKNAIIIVLLLAAMLVLASCSQQLVPEDKEAGTAEMDQDLGQKEIVEVETDEEDLPEAPKDAEEEEADTGAEEAETDADVAEEPSEEMPGQDAEEQVNVFAEEGVPAADDADVQKMLNKAYATDQLKFSYHSPGSELGDFLVYMKGDIMHLEYEDLQTTPDDEFYTDIYLDTGKGIATAYCMRRMLCGDDYDVPFDVDYSRYGFMTPVDWGKDISPQAEVTGSEQLYKRDTTIIRFRKGTTPVKMWVYEYNKLPARVEYNGESVSYEILSTTVKDEQVEP